MRIRTRFFSYLFYNYLFIVTSYNNYTYRTYKLTLCKHSACRGREGCPLEVTCWRVVVWVMPFEWCQFESVPWSWWLAVSGPTLACTPVCVCVCVWGVVEWVDGWWMHQMASLSITLLAIVLKLLLILTLDICQDCHYGQKWNVFTKTVKAIKNNDIP